MISASAVDTFRSCPRKKVWDWVDPQPFESGLAAQHGTLIHGVAEQYHKHGTQPDETAPPFQGPDGELWLSPGKAFLPALPFLPRPKVGIAEGKFSRWIEGIQYIGFIDLTCHSDDIGLSYGAPVVIDYKSKDSLTARGMLNEPGDFLADPQAILYALKTMLETGFDQVLLRWVYIKRKGKPAAKASDALLSRKDIEEAFYAVVHKPAQQIVTLRTNKKRLDPHKVPWNSDTCLKYGPRYACPRIEQCNLTAQQKLAGPSGGMMDDLLAELEAMSAQPKPAPTKAEVAAEPPKPVNSAPVKTEVPPYPSPGKMPDSLAVFSDKPTDAEIGRVVRFLLGK